MPHLIYILILVFVIGGFLFEQILSFLNNRARSQAIPANLSDIYSDDKYQKYRNYRQESYRFGVLSSWFSFGLMLAMLLFGFVMLDNWVAGTAESSLLQSLIFFAVLGLASEILTLPFDIYDTFVIEQKYGFNKTTPRLYITDKLKGLMLAAVIGGGLLSLIIWLYMVFGSAFWWLAWIAFTLFSVFFAFFYSSLIVPLFNKQTPLEEGELRSKLTELGSGAGFNISNIFVIDGSKRSTRANAYFSGFGSRRRIVLFDTLIQNQTVEEIVAVVAHEIGHYRKKHIITGLIISTLQTGLLLFLFSLIVDYQVIYEAIGCSRQSFHLGLILFLVLFTPFSLLSSIGGNLLSRRHEFEADAFAKAYAGGEPLARSLRKLSADNMSDLTPHPLYVFFHYSHPPLLQRLERLE